ncbi:MAG: toll/interleukin-1 receptor domain-containing protein [Acidimicrobiia bacterium]
MARDVFICHSSDDADTANAIVAGLEAEGVSCWIAPRDVPTGLPYASGIVNGIRSAKMMLFVSSDAANRSPHIERELERAVHRNIPILPVRIEDTALSDSLEYFISTPHWFEAHDAPIDKALPALVADVRRILGETEGGDDIPPPPVAAPAKHSKRTGLIAGGAAALVLVLAVAGWLLLSSDDSASAGELFLEPASEQGDDPFTSSFAAFEPDGGELTDPPGSDDSGSAELTSATGSDPGLYGGSNELAVCDSAQLVAFLDDEAEKASAFAGVLGIEPDGIGDYVAGLTPLVLREDVRVTNHGFESGSATSFQAVLQTGTAVLVDDLGVPRVKCNCGNPLTSPDDIRGDVTYAGTAWPGYDPALSIVVIAADSPVQSFEVANLTGPPEILGAVDVGGGVSGATLDDGILWSSVYAESGGATASSSVVRTEPESGEVGSPVPVDGALVDLASGDGQLWALTLLEPVDFPKGISGRLTALRLDADTGETTASVEVAQEASVGVPGEAHIVVTDNGDVWVRWATSLMRIDADAGAVAETIELPEGSYTDLAASGSILWTGGTDASGTAGQLVRVDTADGSAEPVPVGSAVSAVAAASSGDAWVGLGEENPDPQSEAERGLLAGSGSVVLVGESGPVGEPVPLENPVSELASDGEIVWGADLVGGSVVRIVPAAGTVEAVTPGSPPAALTAGGGDAYAGVGTEVLEIAPFEAAEVPAGSARQAPAEPVGSASPEEAARAWIEEMDLVDVGACDAVFEAPDAATNAGPSDVCIGAVNDAPGGGAHVHVSFVSTYGEDAVTLYATETDGVWTADVSACDQFLTFAYEGPTPPGFQSPDGTLDETACRDFAGGDGGSEGGEAMTQDRASVCGEYGDPGYFECMTFTLDPNDCPAGTSPQWVGPGEGACLP